MAKVLDELVKLLALEKIEENLFRGQSQDLGWGTGDRATPNALVDAWMNSDHHRRILLSSVYAEIGVGVGAGAPAPASSGLPGATYAMDLATIRSG